MYIAFLLRFGFEKEEIMIKYIVVSEEATIAIKYDPKKRELVIGGYKRFISVMEWIIEQALGRVAPRPHWTQKNKVRYIFRVSKFEKVKGMIEKLREEGVTVVEVTNLERIMR